MLFPVPPVREGGRDVANSGEGAREGEPEDGNQDLNLSRIVHLDGKQGNFFFWPGMLVAKCFAGNVEYSWSMITNPAALLN